MRNYLVLCLLVVGLPLHAADDLLVADFEQPDYASWKPTGTAFGSGPAKGTLPNQMEVSGFMGKGLVNSFHGGDESLGTLTSSPFTIQRKYIRFLIGGGGFAGKTCVNLLVDGKLVRTATGSNTQPGGSEALTWSSWDVSDSQNRTAVIEIVDQATGGWGHINVDQILQTDQRLPRLLSHVSRELFVSGRYLNLPVKTGAEKRKVTVSLAGKETRTFDIELAPGQPDWWAFMDTSAYKGTRAKISVDQLPEDSTGLSSIEVSDELKGASDLYHEKLRPQFHFSARRGWNNDPNGLVFFRGEYYLFFQHNPYGWAWGNMHWGHAVSRDLIHWKELPEALYPDEHGTMFSGSAVVDWHNTAGFQTGSEPPIVCIFTAAGEPFTQGLAYSNDRGKTWSKYVGNPVLPHIKAGNRDPKVIWYAPGKSWVMALYLDQDEFALFTSKDLKQWDRLCDIKVPGCSECPEFFEIAVDGNRQDTRWIFYGGNGRYLIGRFDGKQFKADSGPHDMHYGNGWYASQTYNDIPENDGRRILIPWGQMPTPGMPFNQMMGIPVELKLRGTAEGLRIHAMPVKELSKLRKRTQKLKNVDLGPGKNPVAHLSGELLDVVVEFEVGRSPEVGLRLRGVPIVYNVEKQELTCAGQRARLPLRAGKISLRVLVDRSSVEVFGNEGWLYMSAAVIPAVEDRTIETFSREAGARLTRLEVSELEPIWR